MNNPYIPTDQATNGKNRTIRGEKFNTADLVNAAIAATRELSETGKLDMATAQQSLRRLGHTTPTDDLVLRYATQSAMLKILGSRTEANFDGQIGKWNMSSAEAIHQAMNAYLDRRNQGQRARWTQRH
jgi:hypothetical protein